MTGLAIFARAPAERVKTRLLLDPKRATRLYAAMLEDVVDTARRVSSELQVWYADAIGPDFGLVTHHQRGDDLGARMQHALATLLESHESAILIGSDAPTLPERCIRAAIDALHDHSLVLGPSADGGYYLIGARRVPSFESVRWSTSTTLADTCAANPGAHCVEPWYDVDRPADLTLLSTHLRLDPEAAPVTARLLDSTW